MSLNEDIEKLRESAFKELAIPFDIAVSRILFEMIGRTRAMPSENAEDKATIIAYNKVIKDFMSLKNLLDTMQQQGRPKELVFIDLDGNSHDLLNSKELNFEEGINLFLDNWKKKC